MNIISIIIGISLMIFSVYLCALGITIILGIDLIYGFVFPIIAGLIIGLVRSLNFLHIPIYIFLLICSVVGLINLWG